MKSHASFVLLALLACIFTLCHAWTKEDHEIFRLRDEIVNAEGSDISFYDIVGVDPSASQAEINKATRKRSLKVHPDKAIPSMLAKLEAPQAAIKAGEKKTKPTIHVKKGPSQKQRAQVTNEANEAYARFRTVANILQTESRERYDHFLKNGFPTWKGSGYYYARFRPGLLTVLIGLFVVFGGVGHYVAMFVSFKRQREFMERYVTHARKQAWGNNIPGIESIGAAAAVPPPAAPEEDQFAGLNRRQKRMQEKEAKKKDTGRVAKTARANGISKPVEAEPITGPQGSRKKVVAQNGKILIVDSAGDVYVEETTEEGESHEYLIDPDAIQKPSVLDTALFRLPLWLFNQSAGRLIDKFNGTSEMQDAGFLSKDGVDLTLHTEGEDGIHTATALNSVEDKEARKRKAKSRR